MLYITTIAFNNPLFLELQYKSFLKYLKDEFKFIVFDDSKDKIYTEKIKKKCNELNIKYIRVDPIIHRNRNLVFKNKLTDVRQKMMKLDNNVNRYIVKGMDINHPGTRHCNSIQFIFNYFLENKSVNDISILFNLDSDMFLIDNLNINKLLYNYDMAIVKQGNGGVVYLWPNIFIINFIKCKNLKDISWDGCRVYKSNGTSNYTDTGGETFEYILKNYDTHKNKKIFRINDYFIDKQKNLDSLISSNRINLKSKNLINNIIKLYDYKYFNKEFLLEYNGKFSIFHLRGYTWTNIYKNTKEKINNILSNFYENKINFIHIGKCAGGTITNILRKNINNKNLEITHCIKPKNYNPNIFYIIAIRCPVKRAVSSFNWTMQCKDHQPTIDEFNKYVNINNLAEKLMIEDSSFNKSKNFIKKFGSHLNMDINFYLNNFLNSINNYNNNIFIIRQEFIEKDLEELKVILKNKLNINLDFNLKKDSDSKLIKWKDSNTYLSLKGINNLIDFYKEDYNCLNKLIDLNILDKNYINFTKNKLLN